MYAIPLENPPDERNKERHFHPRELILNDQVKIGAAGKAR
jgi:hypothetical protein